MRTAAFVIGLIGGILGLLAGLLQLGVGGGVQALTAQAEEIIGYAVGTVVLSVAGIVGAALARTDDQGWGSVLMIVAGFLGFVTGGWLWLLSGPMLIAAGVLLPWGRTRTAR